MTELALLEAVGTVIIRGGRILYASPFRGGAHRA